MIAFSVTDNYTGDVCQVCWTRGAAELFVKEQKESDKEDGIDHSYEIVSVEVEDLAFLVNSYYKFRELVDPNASEAFLFLVSEIGELSDAIVQSKAEWVRNNPDKKDGSTEKISDEIGDVLMMLVKTAEKFGIDPVEAMKKKFKKKGFEPNEMP